VPESLLLSLGARFKKDEVQFDMYFSPPLQNIWKRGEMLRIRRNGTAPDDLSLTYKAILPSGIVRFDMHLTSQEFRLFQNHYVPTLIVRKHRKTFILGAITINLDAVKGLSEWTEFCISDFKQEAILKELIERLNRDPASATTATYLSMMLAKNPAP
jgi:adenylate cyclase class IV